MGMPKSQLDRLDDIARDVIAGRKGGYGVLSTGEKIYVAMAANKPALLKALDYTMPQAISRLGEDDTRELVERWRYVG